MLIHRQMYVLRVGLVTVPIDWRVIFLDLSCSLIDVIGLQDRLSMVESKERHSRDAKEEDNIH